MRNFRPEHFGGEGGQEKRKNSNADTEEGKAMEKHIQLPPKQVQHRGAVLLKLWEALWRLPSRIVKGVYERLRAEAEILMLGVPLQFQRAR